MGQERQLNSVVVTVGRSGADICGQDGRALQAAVDYVGNLGGGVVKILPGEYVMSDSLHLSSGVTVKGSGPDTVLVKSPGVSSPLVLDGDYGEEEITLADPSGFYPGMGVSIKDDRAVGCWHTTVATITGQDGNRFAISRPMVLDYLVSSNARVDNAFPVISARDVENVGIENLRVEGSKDSNVLLSGCRGAGIYLYRADNVTIRDCIVENFNGDGISYQKCADVVIENCRIAHNTSFGLHPGSGSQRPIIRGCQVTDNGIIGLFVCWRVKHGCFENNVFSRNGHVGLSIGHKDTDNIIRNNEISGNGDYGIHFREELEAMAAHRNLVEGNRIYDNGNEQSGYGIRIDSRVHGVVLRDNIIGSDNGDSVQRYAVYKTEAEAQVTLQGNQIWGTCVGVD
ncbi:MAG: hypothetical protein GX030_08045 [Firmicutes bacterium]|nr:hypothetical protein [Bacillota bacterium]